MFTSYRRHLLENSLHTFVCNLACRLGLDCLGTSIQLDMCNCLLNTAGYSCLDPPLDLWY